MKTGNKDRKGDRNVWLENIIQIWLISVGGSSLLPTKESGTEIFRNSLSRRDYCRGLGDILELKSKRMMAMVGILEKLEKYCICWMEIDQHQAPLQHNEFAWLHSKCLQMWSHHSISVIFFLFKKMAWLRKWMREEYYSLSYLFYKEQNTLLCSIMLNNVIFNK